MLKKWVDARDGSYGEHGGFVFTSNVDGQFQRAGFAAEQIQEVHGSIHHLQCTNYLCMQHSGIWDATTDTANPDVTFDAKSLTCSEASLPGCDLCTAVARPNILMFGDFGWLESRRAIQAAAMDAWLTKVGKKVSQDHASLVVIDIGSGTAVPTCRRTAEFVSQSLDVNLIRINSREAEIPAECKGISLPMGHVAFFFYVAFCACEQPWWRYARH